MELHVMLSNGVHEIKVHRQFHARYPFRNMNAMFDVMIDSTNTYRRSQMLISVRVVLLLWVTVCVGVCNCARMDVIIVRTALMSDTDTF